MPKLEEGFIGQKFLVIPRSIIRECTKNRPETHLYVTDIGYFPQAKFHYCKRDTPINDYIFIYCRNGEGWINIGSNHYGLRQDEFIIIPAGARHEYGANEVSPWTIYWIHFNGKYASKLSSQFDKPTKVYSTRILAITALLSQFELIYEVLDSGLSDENIKLATANTYAFLNNMIYLSIFRENLEGQKIDLVERAIAYLQENLDKKITSRQLCSHLKCSATTLANKFKDRVGSSPMNYLNHLRIRKACNYLDNTNLTISQICIKVGVEDPYYFSRLFNIVMGMSPSRYKKQPKW